MTQLKDEGLLIYQTNARDTQKKKDSVQYNTVCMWKRPDFDYKSRETSSCEAQRTCEPAWFPIYCLRQGSMYLYSWLNKALCL